MATGNKLRDLLYGAGGTLLAAGVLWIGNMSVEIRDSVHSLEQYHASEWPLERQILSIETSQLRAELNVLKSDLEDLEQEIEDLQ